jgi:hypothetical protein
MAVLLFQKEQLLDATIHIRSRIVPGVIWVVLPRVTRCAGDRDLKIPVLCLYQTTYPSGNFRQSDLNEWIS